MDVIAVCNQKGGVGKTTTVASLGVVFSRQGRRVHLVDADPQASLSRRGFQHADGDGLLYESLRHRIALPVIRVAENLTLSPSSIHLAKGESEFLSLPAREYLLRKSLRLTELPEDTLVLIDCPPSLGILTFNCLTAADKVVIPLEPDELAVDVLPNLQDTIDTAHEHLNSELEILGVVLTKVDERKKITGVFKENIEKAYRLLGTVHGEAELQYAVGGGRIQELEKVRSLDEYEQVAGAIGKRIWQDEKTLAPA